MSYPATQNYRQSVDRRRSPGYRFVSGLILTLALLWGMLPTHTATAMPAAQADVGAIGLGEYGVAIADAGSSLTFTVEIPEAGSYVIVATNEEIAATFGLTATDADGEVIYSDIFTTFDAELSAGPLTLTFEATENEVLLFVVAGELGSMSADSSQPGRLVVGGAYSEELITGARYATLNIAPSPSPQQVLIYVESSTDDVFLVQVEGDDIDVIGVETDMEDALTFWSSGGSYQVTVEPYERRSTFSLITFQTPPAAILPMGEIVDAMIPANAGELVFQVELDTSYDLIALDLFDDTEGLTIEFVDDLNDPSVYFSGFDDPYLDVPNVLPGVYYVRVTREEIGEPRFIVVRIDGEAGIPVEEIILGEAATGFLDEETETVYYRVEIPQAGALVAVAIASSTEDAEFDIIAGFSPGDSTWYTFSAGAEDTLVFVAPFAGTYFVGIENAGSEGDYALAVISEELAPEVPTDGSPVFGVVDRSQNALHRIEVTEPNQLVSLYLVGTANADLDVQLNAYSSDRGFPDRQYGFNLESVELVSMIVEEHGVLELVVVSYTSDPSNYVLMAHSHPIDRLVSLWAIDAAASTEYGEDGYGAIQATGAPDTLLPGDAATAWAPLEADDGEQWLELAYEFPLVPAEINIYESYNPGAIFSVEVYDLANEEWVVVWEDEPGPIDEPGRVLSIETAGIDVVTDGVRIWLDTSAVEGWNEIDAVELRGRP